MGNMSSGMHQAWVQLQFSLGKSAVVGEGPKLEEGCAWASSYFVPKAIFCDSVDTLVFAACGKQGMGERQGLTVPSWVVLYLYQAQGYPNPHF